MNYLLKQAHQQGQAAQTALCTKAKAGWRLKLKRWRQLRRERHALRYLSDATLKDIGLSREQVQSEASKPFWNDKNWCR
ncbi:DUF1127 domain-containing protein [Vreelandella olivaria]|uniref:DUF1127 domain-containing protein n=1 Tax=Vreelandella olivaria TaxID=390919 RepID=UPI00201EFFE5|nr:DUF1127 domain-containing protein [Halomonas olivaria]